MARQHDGSAVSVTAPLLCATGAAARLLPSGGSPPRASLRGTMGRRKQPDEAELRKAKAQRAQIERLARLNQIEQNRFAEMTRAKLQRQEAAAQRVEAKRRELRGEAQLRGQEARKRAEAVRTRAWSAREERTQDAMKLAEWVRMEKRAPQPPPVTPHLRAQRFRRAKGPLASGLQRPQAVRPQTAAPPAAAAPLSPAAATRPHTAPQSDARSAAGSRKAGPLPSPGFRSFRPREAPPMPALTPVELGRLGLVVKQPCGVCLRQFKLCDLPGVSTKRAVARLREGWSNELGTTEPVCVDVRSSKPAQYYSEVRLCVFCFQFLSSGLDEVDNDPLPTKPTAVPPRSQEDQVSPVGSRSSESLVVASSPPVAATPPVARTNGSRIPMTVRRSSPTMGDDIELLEIDPVVLAKQAAATASAVAEAQEEAKRAAEQKERIRVRREARLAQDAANEFQKAAPAPAPSAYTLRVSHPGPPLALLASSVLFARF